MSSSELIVVVGGEPVREPDALCEGCGVRGTVSRATRQDGRGNALEVHRFCAKCWPEQSARYEARWREERRIASDHWHRHPNEPPPPPSGMSFETATWHGILKYLEGYRRDGYESMSEDVLARTAADIQARAPEMEGPMPYDVELFVRRFGRGNA